MRLSWTCFVAACLLSATAKAQDSYAVQPLEGAPPDSLATTIKADIASTGGVRLMDDKGKAVAEIWVRKSIPASARPSGAKGAIQFPVLAEGELLGVIRFLSEGHDYRDQTIPAGVYTLRYGLQPVNGDHLGVSPNRDYALLIPASKDTDLAPLAKKPLEARSAEAAGSSHPGVFMLLAAPGSATAPPTIARDEAKNTWGAVFNLPLSVKGDSTPATLRIQMVVVGIAM